MSRRTLAVVCAGNICRSPIAEHVLRAHLSDDVQVHSAGLWPHHLGGPADPDAVAVLTAAGYPSDHRCAGVTTRTLLASLVLAVEPSHATILRNAGARRVELLDDFDPLGGTGTIPNPWRLGRPAFEGVLATVERCAPAVRNRLARGSAR